MTKVTAKKWRADFQDLVETRILRLKAIDVKLMLCVKESMADRQKVYLDIEKKLREINHRLPDKRIKNVS